MQAKIHPTYYTDSTTTCACGAILHAGATKQALNTEICSQCHPFYTGKKKFVDSTGRVDRFRKLATRASAKKDAHQATKTAKKSREDERDATQDTLGAEA